ncbi:aldehyde dehydrogenase family protein [Arthrobacter sp. JCM 19049]|uniref:aldehyde dehydrogenase family protein n=1 Tax=Arthrobacter sp. JCM 19049 TaxID=1460643 RepID=UPI00243691F7|nr:aldehyde dehydrogenase family protein [Arthrobacter sp. JCM 19049]
MLVKAHSGHPRLSDTMAAVIEEAVVQAGAPADLLRVIHGTQNGVEALKHPAIKAASFTGSISGGRALFDIATPTRADPVLWRAGQRQPCVRRTRRCGKPCDRNCRGLPRVDHRQQGQLCTKPGVLFVPAESG